MKKSVITSLCVIVAMTLLYWVPGADGYEKYDGCKGCHGDFRDKPYTAKSDGVNWESSLHDVHRNDMLNGDCDACHFGTSTSFKPVNINLSIGGSAGFDISCVGCHDGAGLKEGHLSTNCYGCHDYKVPDGENVLPPYYAALSIDPCNLDSSEDYAGGPNGLDNDGDDKYDGDDDDCLDGVDNDSDGYAEDVDCNDNDSAINPSATEVCDGKDNNCDGNIDETFDIDGDGYTICGEDCNDNDAAINPEAAEICDGIDNNCDGVTDDAGCNCTNGDMRSCGSDTGECLPGEEICMNGQWSACSGAVGPASETCDGKDNNCDGRIDDGVTNACGTCGAVPSEVCDGIDNDCDGAVDNGIPDTPTTCGQGECGSTGVVQCVNGGLQDTCVPGSPSDEQCGDGIDQDCDGSDLACPLIDNDGDRYAEDVDCNDNDAAINPGAEDICNDGIDQDCSGEDRTKGKGCKTKGGREGKGKTCSDLIDNDNDKLLDCLDSDCSRNRSCK